MKHQIVGNSFIRKEGLQKVLGQAQYIDDYSFDGMIFGITIRSSIARGKIKKILFDTHIPWDEYIIVSAKDIPSKNVVALIIDDQPCLAESLIHHAQEPILLLAHHNKYALEKARNAIHIEYEEYEPVLSIEDSLSKKQVIWGNDNIIKAYHLNKGDVDSVWSNADFIIEGEYRTGAQEQLYIEPNGIIAWYQNDSVTIWGSMQCPYYIHKAVTYLFGFADNQVRVIQTETGGGFGGKEEYPSMLACHAALLSYKSQKPVKMIYDRAEDMAATTKRHPSFTRHKTAVSKDGKILGMEIQFYVDGGAYSTLSSVVLSRGTIHAAGPYVCENIRITSKALATNSPPNGAFRGFGAPQTIFALERHLDKIAYHLGISPVELRKKNFIHHEQTTATGQVVHDTIDMSKLLDRALSETQYHEKYRSFHEDNKTSHIKRGIGIASFMHGAGFTGSGEKMLGSVVEIKVSDNDTVLILSSSTEIGQGTNTIFSQIAAETLGIEYDDIHIITPDTNFVPNSGPTVASRTCMIVGRLVQQACENIIQELSNKKLLQIKFSRKDFFSACELYKKKHGDVKLSAKYEHPPHIHWDENLFSGDAYGTFAWAVYIAEVSVDTHTYETKVDRFYALQEVGKVINPALAKGQIEGGIVQGIGFTLYENVITKNGAMINNQMTNYIIPTSSDISEIIVKFEENPYHYGPYGAKGIGELPMDGPAPAIANALFHALQIHCDTVPILPEKILEKVYQHER